MEAEGTICRLDLTELKRTFKNFKYNELCLKNAFFLHFLFCILI